MDQPENSYKPIPVGYEVECPNCHDKYVVTQADLDSGEVTTPYIHPEFGTMFNFRCPSCGNQNGIKLSDAKNTANPEENAAPEPETEPTPEPEEVDHTVVPEEVEAAAKPETW